MKCPSCTDTQLVVTTRSDIEIDLCPRCRGVWLDRGELDKIIARSERHPPDDDDYDDDQPYAGRAHGGPRPERRRSWWTELFD